jgi:hypothetical protein
MFYVLGKTKFFFLFRNFFLEEHILHHLGNPFVIKLAKQVYKNS